MGNNFLVSVSIPYISYHLEPELSLKCVQPHPIDTHAQSQQDDIFDEHKCLPRIPEQDLYRLILEEATENYRKQEGYDGLYGGTYQIHHIEYHIHLCSM